jgi:ADP-L-glycero-D-manno-heptose 6-epimerase
MASMVWHAYQQLVRTGEVTLFRSTDAAYPDGGQQRDFVFVVDCIAQLLWLWQHPHVCGLFNSGTGMAQTFNELVLAVYAALGCPPHIRYIEMPVALRHQYQNFTQADMSKLGPGSHRARVAYAQLDGDQVVYEIDSSRSV